MRFERFPRVCGWLLVAAALIVTSCALFAQETTGGLAGTIKDTTGAVVSGAHVEVTGAALEGSKSLNTDSTGTYHFANLPPGLYTITVTAKGFKVTKREGLNLEVGHLPTVDIALEVGTAAEVVEVSGQAPVIDVTTTTNQTNLTQDTLDNSPHGLSFQSVIQYAPMARNEPLGGMSGGNGGSLPGSSGNGFSVGFSIGGAADSESSYLVEGQDTEDISGGASRANVPFDFIQEVEVKTSGIEAENGGALGGVINVIMKKGGNAYHGSFSASYESDGVDGSPNGYIRYNPDPVQGSSDFNIQNEANTQTYLPKQDHYRTVQPGFSIGGPIVKDRVAFFAGFEPLYQSRARTVNFGPPQCSDPSSPLFGNCPNQSLGSQVFTQDNQQYYGTARIDASLSQKVRVFGSWLYQFQRESGVALPNADDKNGLINTSIGSSMNSYSHGLGFSSPNATYNFGADISLTPKVVSTTRLGYFFNNYHDFGWPTTGNAIFWEQVPGGSNVTDNAGNIYPTSISSALGGSITAPHKTGYTQFNASKHIQFNEDVAVFKSGWAGTHNLKFGYQLNHLSNVIDQHGNVPLLNVWAQPNLGYGQTTSFGNGNCAALGSVYFDTTQDPPAPICTGEYGYVTNSDFATILKNDAGKVVPAIDWNHALFIQDAWTVGHGLTLSLGLRVEKESLPAPPGIGVAAIKTIAWSWSDKVEPRLGVAWGSRDGKMKIFGSYGVTNDVMKLLLAQTSFGAQGWDNCTYPLGPDASGGFTPTDLTFVGNAQGRACPTGPSSTGAIFAGGTTPTSLVDAATGVSLIENTNYRPEEPVATGVKPYRQHEYVAGVDYQLTKSWALEARYDRRRLDHVIEDASLADPEAFEIYTIVNPGQGVNKTLNGYASYLASIGAAYGPGVPAFNANNDFGTCTGCPDNPTAVRNYDGLEIRLTKSSSKGWAGLFSYTWSSLWGNYTGLTTTDQLDGGATGRNSPDTTRSFDEPIYYFNYKGTSANGPLPTDRPNALKGNVYYNIPWKGGTTSIGFFQVAYQGSPVSSWADVGLGEAGGPIEGTYIWGRGNWVNATVDPGTGITTLGNVYARRTPWYIQTDGNLSHSFKVNKNNEHQVLSFQATAVNLFNQHSVVAYWQGLNSDYQSSGFFEFYPFAGPGYAGAAFYQAVETGYNPQTIINTDPPFGVPLPLHSAYGTPNQWQLSRNLRFAMKFTF